MTWGERGRERERHTEKKRQTHRLKDSKTAMKDSERGRDRLTPAQRETPEQPLESDLFAVQPPPPFSLPFRPIDAFRTE